MYPIQFKWFIISRKNEATKAHKQQKSIIKTKIEFYSAL